MTSGSLTGLNDHLFSALDRLAKEGLSGQDLADEVARASAIVAVADKVTDNARTQLAAAKLFAEHGSGVLPMLPQIAAPKAK